MVVSKEGTEGMTPQPPPSPGDVSFISRLSEGLIVAITSAIATILGIAYQWWSGKRQEDRKDKETTEAVVGVAMKSISEATETSIDTYEKMLNRLTSEVARIDAKILKVQKENDALKVEIQSLHKAVLEADGHIQKLTEVNIQLMAEIESLKKELKNGNR